MAGNMNLGRSEHAEISFGRKYSRQNSARIRTALNPQAYPDMLTSGQMSMPKPVCQTWRPPLPSARRAQTAEKQHAGLLKLDAQPRLG